jgi:hypothetical protein
MMNHFKLLLSIPARAATFGSLKMYIHYPTAVQDGDRLLVVYSVMGHPHLHLGDVGGIKIAIVPLRPPAENLEDALAVAAADAAATEAAAAEAAAPADAAAEAAADAASDAVAMR